VTIDILIANWHVEKYCTSISHHRIDDRVCSLHYTLLSTQICSKTHTDPRQVVNITSITIIAANHGTCEMTSKHAHFR